MNKFLTKDLPLMDRQEAVVHRNGISIDVDTLPAAKGKIKNLDLRLNAVVETAVDAIITINERGIIETVNPATERMFGYSHQEMIGQNVSMLMPAPYRQEHDGYLAHYRASGERKIIGIGREVEAQRKDGSVFPIGLSISEIQVNGEHLFTGIIRDITERKCHLKEIEVLNAHLQRAMQETHHRVKNNLQVIASMLDMLMGSHPRQVPTEEINRISQHILSLAALHDLLTQNARAGDDVEYISTKQALENLLPVLERMLGDKRLTFQAEEALVPVKQAAALSVLVNEMLINAVKHGEGPIDLTFTINDGHGCLSVCDRGPGFPEGFDPRVAANMGLELIQGLSRWDLGGQVTFENRPEGGARVRVAFPLIGSRKPTEGPAR